MNISKLVNLNPENEADKRQFKEEFWRLVKEHNFGDVMEELVKHTMESPMGRETVADLKKQGIPADTIAQIFLESFQEGLMKLICS